MEQKTLGTCSYSPEDSKLRFYPAARLDADTYARVKSAGFIWAPKQELFVAPMWTPEREDLLLELCGEIGDEDTSLIDRAEQRAERFEDYSEHRAQDAEQAHKAVAAIADNIPLGQPILCGHHSERHARKDAERIENGMRRAVKMWETSKYWQQRAAGAIRHAKYKERPDVRARRIKTIEAAKRKQERNRAEAESCFKFWRGECTVKKPDGTKELLAMTEENKGRILHLIGNSGGDYSRLPVAKKADSESWWSAWTAYDVLQPDGERYQACPAGTVAQCVQRAKEHYPPLLAHHERWIAHYNNRLEYERAMLAAEGGLAGEKFNFEVGGRVNVRRWGWKIVLRVNQRAGVISSLSVSGCSWSIGLEEVLEYQPPIADDSAKVKNAVKVAPLCNYPGEGFLHQTKEEWEKSVPKWSDFPKYATVAACDKAGKHRVRQNRKPGGQYYNTVSVYLTDSKRVDPPAPSAPVKLAPFVPPTKAPEPIAESTPKPADPDKEKFEAMRETLKAGVQVVSAPQLFPTPPGLAQRMVEAAELEKGQSILEPSAGTGRLIDAAALSDWEWSGKLVAVEINFSLAHGLAAKYKPEAVDIRRTDFLTCNGDLGKFDRVLMNPPFANGQDISHIKHALTFLKPGGRLVAICANGPKQREALQPLASEWIDLEPGTFKESGTNVNAAMLVVDA